MTLKRRALLVFPVTAFILGSYKIIQELIPHLYDDLYDLKLPGEEAIPFLPEMLIIYLMVYLVPVIMLLIVDKEHHFRHFVKAFLIAYVIHAVFFLLLPVKYGLRPELPEVAQSWIIEGIRLVYLTDAPTNNFPSMHVSFAFLSYFCMRRFNSRHARAFLIIAVAIAFSTLFVKQHYVLDVVGAFVLARGLDGYYLSVLRLEK